MAAPSYLCFQMLSNSTRSYVGLTCYNYKLKNVCNITRRFVMDKSRRQNKLDGDYIGPPNALSNLRPIIFYKPKNESYLERIYRENREATQNWNEQFWTKHNLSFIQERQKFRDDLKLQGKENITADDMSIFYKKFLDKNWKTHVEYNILWYKKNFYLIYLELRVNIYNLKYKHRK